MRANLIAGQWTAGKQTNPDINPSDVSDVIDQYASGDAAAVDAAVAAARAAFPAWSGSTPQQRFDALDFAGSEILARRAELGELLAREEGKTLPEATGEAARAGQIFKFFAGEALRTAGEIIPSIRPGMSVEVTREPIGVVGLITPWNFPIAIPAWKIAPALAYGNCVVFKPADLVPGCGWALADILSRSGLPAGVFIIVTQGIHDKFVSRLAERARALVVGDARDPKTQIGPVVDARQLEQDERYIGIGKGEGAKLLAGGERVKRDKNGYYFAPAVFAEANNSMRICREEIFGPVAAVVRARDYDEALALANDTEFGLSSGICTTSLKHASHFKRHAEAGLVR